MSRIALWPIANGESPSEGRPRKAAMVQIYRNAIIRQAKWIRMFICCGVLRRCQGVT